MGCGSRRVKADDLRPEQKWDFISLNDFKSTSCFTPFAYAYLWISLFISTAVYAVDTFTAINLLAFNRWSGEINPYIPLNISKWIFSGCIIASWVNLGFEHLRAFRTMRRGAVAESYLDNLAVRLECIRMGNAGRGWRRFLVFAELTKSKKGAEYVALFTYFAFQSWIRVIFCQGPRQVINAMTLYSVFKSNLDPSDAGDVGDTLVEFFKKIGILAEAEHQQAVILSGMVFTLVIWIFSILSLILAILFYLLFLWHYVPNSDGGLTGYCERKINDRLTQIVSVKVNKAIEEEERKRAKAEAKAVKKGEKPPTGRQATLPTFADSQTDGDKLPEMPMLSRQDTMTTLPQYTSRPGTPSGNVPQVASFELDQLEKARPQPGRSITGSSYASNAPLLNNAGPVGYGRSSPPPSVPDVNTDVFPGPQRTNTAGSQNSQWQRGPPQGPPRMFSPMGPDRGFTASPMSYADGRNTPGFPGPQRQNTMDSYGRPIPRSNTPMGPPPSMGRRTPFDPNMQNQNPQDRMMSPPPGSEYGRQTPFNPNLQNQARGSPAPGSEFGGGRRTPMDPYAQNQAQNQARRTPFDPSLQQGMGRSSPAPAQQMQAQAGNNNAYHAYNPQQEPHSPVSSMSGANSEVGGEQMHAGNRYFTDPGIPRAATAGPMQQGGGGMRRGEYGDEEMGLGNGERGAPRRAATFGDEGRGGGYGGNAGAGQQQQQWGGYRS
ncbi:pheromone-regulated membrane protein [Rutstroemia sp. NJR-2017a BVV2]|nr:pheromone-regulated membrane protein [Rutstroemia sp. NJR-2017a BVV2]